MTEMDRKNDMTEKTTPLTITDREYALPGNRACTGCGLALSYRHGLKGLGEKTILTVPACCLTVLQGMYPISSMTVPCLNTAFETTAASAAGIRAGLDALGKKDVTVVGWAGDGGTADIGIQALSGAAERNTDIIYVCYDNEAYMNTGTQKSGSTPFGARTSTTVDGKIGHKKDMPRIMPRMIFHTSLRYLRHIQCSYTIFSKRPSILKAPATSIFSFPALRAGDTRLS